jgi:hypothetical protein
MTCRFTNWWLSHQTRQKTQQTNKEWWQDNNTVGGCNSLNFRAWISPRRSDNTSEQLLSTKMMHNNSLAEQ